MLGYIDGGVRGLSESLLPGFSLLDVALHSHCDGPVRNVDNTSQVAL